MNEAPIYVDMNAVHAACAKNDAVLRPRAELPGWEGALARVQLAVETPFGVALAEEMNRQTNADDVEHAVAGALTDIIMSFAQSVTPENLGRVELVKNVNSLLIAQSLCLRQALSGEATRLNTSIVPVTRGGHA